LEGRHSVLVLQHPQEQDVVLASAPVLARGWSGTAIRVGLSWPSLAAAWGGPAEPARWAVIWPQNLPRGLTPAELAAPAVFLDRRGAPLDPTAIDGLVVLDGTWSQAKTLWWRNAWLLKLARIVVHPREPSIYGKLRKEPRREFVSTLEAVADALVAVGEPEQARSELRRAFRTMVQRARDLGRADTL
jgi:DTW domain-containing protein YfiP